MEDKKAHDLAVVMAKGIMGNDFREEKTEPAKYYFCLENWDQETDYRGSYESERIALEQAEIEILNADDEILIGTKVFIAKFITAPIPAIDVESIFDDIGCQYYDEFGEVADDYLNNVKEEHKEILSNELNNVFEQWMKKYNYLPHFTYVNNIKVYVYDGAKWVLDNA